MNYGSWMTWQIDYLLWLQNFRDLSHHIFDKFFIYITLFGEVTIPIIIMCLFYWVINKRVGQFILWSWISGFIINLILKATACIYRPWILDSRVHPVPEAIPAATGYSFPSGHTAGVMSVWGAIAMSYWRNKLIRYGSFAVIFFVMLSRNYLGVHTPQDVIVSFIVSCFVLWGVNKLVNFVYEHQDGKYDIAIASAFSVAAVLTLLYIFLKPYPIHYLFGKILYLPSDMNTHAFMRSGFMFGSLWGWVAERRCIGFTTEPISFVKKVIRFSIGILILFGMHSIIKMLTQTAVPHYEIYVFIQYIILGLFITFIYPYVIKKYNL